MPDPLADLLAASNLTTIAAHARRQRQVCLADGLGSQQLAELWQAISRACQDLQPEVKHG